MATKMWSRKLTKHKRSVLLRLPTEWVDRQHITGQDEVVLISEGNELRVVATKKQG